MQGAARRSLLAATNQGIVLVLAMVVIGGLVGGGGLGYQVVAGLAQCIRKFFVLGLGCGYLTLGLEDPFFKCTKSRACVIGHALNLAGSRVS